jgi:cyclopropane-fatty-acyl-phospholipid synthase
MLQEKKMTKFIEKLIITNFEGAPKGSIRLLTPEGCQYEFKGSEAGPHCELKINSWKGMEDALKKSDIGLGESYARGEWSTSNLADFLTYCTLNINAMKQGQDYGFWHKLALNIYNKFLRANTKSGSQRNIWAHYDISNSFYQRWLDPSMTYSSALRVNKRESLHEAQNNKYQKILDMLHPKGDILEIGCGWGGFAEAAAEASHKVTGITISKKQYGYASQRLGSRAEIALQDYRDIKKKYEGIVSIEMFEAVGEKYWPTYFNKIRESLIEGGKAVIQTITIKDELFESYRKGSDYIRHYVFPGGMLPSPGALKKVVEKANLQIQSHFEFGEDYAWTLRRWLENFHKVWKELLDEGYTPSFLRAWEFYLCYCIAGFESRQTNVMQIEITH